jgi:hypothetical protein
MKAGTVLGFHYVLRDDGRTVEQFIDPSGKSGVWRTALYWGALRLIDAP